MRFFWDTAFLICKRMLRRPGMLLMTLMLPLICGAAGLYLSRGGEALQIRVGVSVREGDAFGEALYEGLGRFDSPILFERYTPEDEARLEREVAAGRMECAYLLSPELESSLRRGRARGGVILLKSPRTVIDALAGEMIFASMLRLIGPKMDRELLAEVLGLAGEEAAAVVAESYDYYDQREELFLEPVFLYRNGGEADSPSLPDGGRVLHGLIALFLLAGVIGSLPPLIREAPGILRRLPPGAARAFMLGTGCALFLVGFLQGLLGLAALGMAYPAVLAGTSTELLLLAGYLLPLSLAGAVVILLLRRHDVVYAGGIFLLLLTAALGGVLADLGELSPYLSRASAFFPSRYYIDGVLGGGLRPLLPLAALALACALPTLLLAARRRRESPF